MADTEYCITQFTGEDDNTKDVAVNQFEDIVINNTGDELIIKCE